MNLKKQKKENGIGKMLCEFGDHHMRSHLNAWACEGEKKFVCCCDDLNLEIIFIEHEQSQKGIIVFFISVELKDE